jgi:hypothetical protein
MNLLRNLYRFVSNKYQNAFLDYPVKLSPRYGHESGAPAHPELATLIAAHDADYAKLVAQMAQYTEVFASFPKASANINPAMPAWNNGFLPGLDIIALFSLMALRKPAKYIEIGSGNSTRVVHHAKASLQLPTEIISIDPQPRAEMDQLADQIVRKPFEAVSVDLPELLGPGDVLFVDNSHRILPNSDAMVFFMEVLPRLKPGVLVQIHDVYLPYDYPQFMCDRLYNEQYGLAMYLLANPQRYRPLFPAWYVSTRPELMAPLAPLFALPQMQDVERHGGSFWLEIG